MRRHTEAHWNSYYNDGNGRFFLLEIPDVKFAPWLLYVNASAHTDRWEVKDNQDFLPNGSVWAAVSEALKESPLAAQMDIESIDFVQDAREGDALDEHLAEQQYAFTEGVDVTSSPKYKVWRVNSRVYWAPVRWTGGAFSPDGDNTGGTDSLWEEYLAQLDDPMEASASEAADFVEEKLKSLRFQNLYMGSARAADRLLASNPQRDGQLDYLSSLTEEALRRLELDFDILAAAISIDMGVQKDAIQNVGFVSNFISASDWSRILGRNGPVFNEDAVESYLEQGQEPSFKNMKLARSLIDYTSDEKLTELVIHTLNSGQLEDNGLTSPLEDISHFVRSSLSIKDRKDAARLTADLCRAAIKAAQGRHLTVNAVSKAHEWLFGVATELIRHLIPSSTYEVALPAAEVVLAETTRLTEVLLDYEKLEWWRDRLDKTIRRL